VARIGKIRRNAYKVLDHSEDPGVDGWIILKWMLEKWGCKVWIGFIWLRTETGGGLL
jgi:hypothetical protein